MPYRVPAGRVRSTDELQIGDWVQSHYRNRWKGKVIALHPAQGSSGGCVTCQILVSRHGQPIKKTKFKLHVNYLSKIDDPLRSLSSGVEQGTVDAQATGSKPVVTAISMDR